MKAWTDYPITALGDVPSALAPVRECEVVAWDRDKYATIHICGVTEEVKAGYLYSTPGRCGEAPSVSVAALDKLPYPPSSAKEQTDAAG